MGNTRSSNNLGRFVVVEGPACSGKTELIKTLSEYYGDNVLVTREPGSTDFGRQIRSMLLNPENCTLTPEAKASLVTASRMQHLSEVISPALNAGKMVICDRYTPSTYAYQCSLEGGNEEYVRLLCKAAEKVATPDLILYLKAPVGVLMRRMSQRSNEWTITVEAKSFYRHALDEKDYDVLNTGYEAYLRAYRVAVIGSSSEETSLAMMTNDALSAIDSI